jgi:hypothetical protein
MNEAAKKVWHEGFAPLLSVEALQALRDGLAGNDASLIQGATTNPPPLHCVADCPCEGACAVSYAAWKGDNLVDVREVEEAFAAACFQCDNAIGKYADCRWFLNYWDETPRAELFAQFLPEVEKSLLARLEKEHVTQ